MSTRHKRKDFQLVPFFYDARDGRPIPIVNPTIIPPAPIVNPPVPIVNPHIIPPIPMPTVSGHPPGVITGGTVVTVPGGVVTPAPFQPQPWQWPLVNDQYPNYYHVPMYRDGEEEEEGELVEANHGEDDRFVPFPPRPFYPYPPYPYARPRPYLYPYTYPYPYPPIIGPMPPFFI